jgi:hypothetical protein
MRKVQRTCTWHPTRVKICSGLQGDLQRLAEMTSPSSYAPVLDCNREYADDFAFGSDLVTFRAILRGDGTLVDQTGAIKSYHAPSS